MANYTAKDVAALRQMTGAGMLDCKNALEEAGGDLEKAAQILRREGPGRRGQADRPRGGRGRRGRWRARGDAAAVVELRCETDFVAKADEFVALADELAALVAAKGEDAISELDDEIDRLRTTLKENISVGRVRRLVAEPGQVRRHLPAPAGGPRRQRRRRGDRGRLRGAGPRHRRAHRVRQAGLPQPGRSARGRRGRRAGHAARRSRATRASPRPRSTRSSRAG